MRIVNHRILLVWLLSGLLLAACGSESENETLSATDFGLPAQANEQGDGHDHSHDEDPVFDPSLTETSARSQAQSQAQSQAGIAPTGILAPERSISRKEGHVPICHLAVPR